VPPREAERFDQLLPSGCPQGGEAPRRPFLADEIRRLPADRQLLFVSGREPLLTARVDYRHLRALSGRADSNPMYGDLELHPLAPAESRSSLF
jgi:type IV secretory pathway TraG/TraD family ATPase VirD4